MPDQVNDKWKPDEPPLIPAAKRRRSPSSSTTSASVSDFDDVKLWTLETPLTPVTPATPFSKAPYRPNIYVCPYGECGKAFNRPVRLEEHLRSHTNSRIFRCPHEPCEKDFLRQSHLTHHIKSAHANYRDYACNWTGCDKRFTTGTRLKRHQKVHEGQERFRCSAYPPCSQTFRKHATLQSHINVEHLHLKAFPCPKCTSGFDSAVRLRGHEKNVHGEPRYWCSFCSDLVDDDIQLDFGQYSGGFATYSELQDHMQLKHPPCCNHCSLVCASSGELKRHVDVYHSTALLGESRSFVCPVAECGKSFTKQGNLNIHVKSVHEKEKRFVCGVTDLSETHDLCAWDGADACGQAFGARASLEFHVRRRHVGGQEPINRKKARNDNKSNLPKAKLPAVIKLTGVGYAEELGRDIACIVPLCPFRFVRQYDLKVHARVSHGMLDDEIIEALAEREALTGGKFWVGDFGEDDTPNTTTETHDMYGSAASHPFVSALSMYGPSYPMRKSQPSEEVDMPSDDSPANFDTLDFQALADFCKPMQETKAFQHNLVDPALAQHENT